jgi:HemY protein
MILMIGLIATVVAAYYLAKLIMLDSGYVLISYSGMAVELSFWKAVIILCIILLICYALFRFLRMMLSRKGSVWGWNKRRVKKRSYHKLGQGLNAFFTHEWKQATKLFENGAKHSNFPEMYYLLAARAQLSSETTSNKKVSSLLQKARVVGDGRELAVGLCESDHFQSIGEYQQQQDVLEALYEQYPKNVELMKRLADVYQNHTNNDSGLESILVDMKKQGRTFKHQIPILEHQVFSKKIERTTGDHLVQLWKQADKAIQKDPAIKKAYANALVSNELIIEANHFLTQALNEEFDADLLALYANTADVSSDVQAKQIKKWTAKYTNNPVMKSLLLCVSGQLAMNNKQSDEARALFDESVALKPNHTAYVALSRLALERKDHTAADEYLQKVTESYA